MNYLGTVTAPGVSDISLILASSLDGAKIRCIASTHQQILEIYLHTDSNALGAATSWNRTEFVYVRSDMNLKNVSKSIPRYQKISS